MVLKRLFVTALSALGVGALATGPAFGQDADSGNIPAPDLFNDQITCINNIPGSMARLNPTARPRAATDANPDRLSNLDLGIGMGMARIDDDTTVTNDLFDQLVYVIPPGGNNCGSGDAFNAADIVGSGTRTDPENPGEGSIATDVAEGYTEVLDAFKKVYGDPGVLTDSGTAGDVVDARKELNDADSDDSNYEDLEDALDDAIEADSEARAELNAIAEGPIYQAGIAEWMAKAAVTKSIDDYNDAVDHANDGTTALNGLDYDDKYVPLGNTSLFDGADTLVTLDDPSTTDVDETMVNLDQLRRYTNADGNQLATDENDDGIYDTTNSNFDVSGRLIIPMELDDSTTVDDDLRPAAMDEAMVSVVRTRRTQVNAALEALKKLQGENTNSLLQPLIDEAVDRAQAEADHYNREWSKLLSDRDDQNDNVVEEDVETTFLDESEQYSIASVNADVQAAIRARVSAEEDLRSKAARRVQATNSVASAFTSPATFYQQLVDRREAKKAAADAAVARASEDGRTPSESLTDAADDRQDDLDDAREALADYQALLGAEGDPSRALIDELLKTDGDDGKALVEAISSTYDVAAGAAAEAQEAVDEALSGLTGEGGAIDLNTQRSMDNADSIVQLDGRVTQNEDDIAANTTMIGENRTMIGENRDMIATNSGLITGLRTDVDSNMGRIAQNETDIMTNAGNIMMNDGRITANRTDIDQNTMDIASAMNSIGSNSSAISDNRNMIGELSDDLDVVRAGVAASMALAGMPAINGRGISIGVGSFDGESAFAVGFQIQGEMASFKVGVTSASGATGASAGVGFQF